MTFPHVSFHLVEMPYVFNYLQGSSNFITTESNLRVECRPPGEATTIKNATRQSAYLQDVYYYQNSVIKLVM